MEYVVRRTCRGLQVSVDLLDENGDLIFASNPQDVGVESPEAAGRYCATVSMPQQILLAKTYGVRTNLWVPWDGMLDCVDSLRFSVQELASMGNSIPEGKPGKIVIPCTWRIEPSVIEVDA
jgi:hypothetical protein